MRKILICSDYPFPGKPIYGGIPRGIFAIVQELKNIAPDYEVHVCTFNNDISRSTILQKDNISVHYIQFPFKNTPILVPKQIYSVIMQKYMKKIQPDLIHAHGTGKDYAYSALQWDPASLITVHGVIQEESKYWTGVKGKYHSVTGRRMERYILAKANNLITVSPYVKRMIQSRTHANISVIFSPVEKNFFNVVKSEIPNRLLFVGGIEERKGVDVLIRALAEVKPIIPSIDLHICGGIRKVIYYGKLLSLIQSLDLEKNVTFTGSLSENNLEKEYAEASVFILPSHEESLGLVILEAMATGTPVVATRAGGIPDMIQDGANGRLVDCGDDKQLADVIVSLLLEKEQRKRLGDAGRQSALQYLPEHIARQHLDVYNRILNQSS